MPIRLRRFFDAPPPGGPIAKGVRTLLRRGAPTLAATRDEPALPPKPAELSWRDYLVMLLMIGAELEHSLMVEYLYAAYSLGGPDVPEAHRETVRRWQDEILTIAREEMGHLISVQNALMLLGAPVSLDREDYPWSGPFNAFPFELERLSLESLAKYTYSEMPDDDAIAPHDRGVAERVHEIVGETAGVRVGQIYARIIELVESPALIPDSAFRPESYDAQADWDEWGRSYRPASHKPYAKDPDDPPAGSRKTTVLVPRMATRTELAAGLRAIAAQGEAEELGLRPKGEPSHFHRFAQIFREYDAILAREPRFSPSRPVARNPVIDRGYAGDDVSPIKDPHAFQWAELFNIRYRVLLTLLTFACAGPRENPDLAELRRAPVLSRIFGEMYNLKAIAGVLARLPLADAERPERAGAPFQMPYTLLLPQPESNFWALQLDLLDASEGIVASLLQQKQTSDGLPDGVAYLHALREADAGARAWIQKILGRRGRRGRA